MGMLIYTSFYMKSSFILQEKGGLKRTNLMTPEGQVKLERPFFNV